jgi:hypothetical protein
MEQKLQSGIKEIEKEQNQDRTEAESAVDVPVDERKQHQEKFGGPHEGHRFHEPIECGAERLQ